MSEIVEHSIQVNSAYGSWDVYVACTGEPETPEVRLSFVKDDGQTWFDMTIVELAKIAFLIRQTLSDEGYCQHGFEDDDHCPFCFDSDVKIATTTDRHP